MSKHANVPPTIQLDDDEAPFLNIALNWVSFFPNEAFDCTAFKPSELEDVLKSGRMTHNQIVAGAYFGFLPLPGSSYEEFIKYANFFNKYSDHTSSLEYRQDEKARENDAAYQFGMSRNELKRSFKALNTLAQTYNFGSLQSLFHSGDIIANDPHAPVHIDRKPYMDGPLYLWHLARDAVYDDNLLFTTCVDWVLCLKKQEETVFGRAILPSALKFGDFAKEHPFQAITVAGPGFHPVIQVPAEIKEELAMLATNRFPDCEYSYVEPPRIRYNPMFNW